MLIDTISSFLLGYSDTSDEFFFFNLLPTFGGFLQCYCFICFSPTHLNIRWLILQTKLSKLSAVGDALAALYNVRLSLQNWKWDNRPSWSTLEADDYWVRDWCVEIPTMRLYLLSCILATLIGIVKWQIALYRILIVLSRAVAWYSTFVPEAYCRISGGFRELPNPFRMIGLTWISPHEHRLCPEQPVSPRLNT